MSLHNFERPWLFNIKAVAYLVMGLMAILQIKYTLPVVLLVFALLQGFNAFLRFGEVFMLKIVENRTQNLILGSISLIFIIWFIAVFQNFDITASDLTTSRISAVIVIIAWLVFMTAVSLIETISLLIRKSVIGYLFLIDALFTGMMAYFFYRVVQSAENIPVALVTFGIYSICCGLASIALSKILVVLNKAS